MGGLKHWRLDYVWYGSSDTRMLSRIESGNHYLTLVGTGGENVASLSLRPLRISAFSALNGNLNAEGAEIRREPPRRALEI